MCRYDEAYLSREVETFRERERKHEEEEDRLRDKVRALKQARDALQERLLSGAEDIRSQHEDRLTQEVAGGGVDLSPGTFINTTRFRSTRCFTEVKYVSLTGCEPL